MQIEERVVGGVVVVVVTGDITLNKGDIVLKDKVQSLMHQGHLQLLVDLGGVSYMDSAGLGQLVQAYATVSKHGGSLKLLRVAKRLKDLLTITKLVTVFESYDDEAAAVASFAAPA